MIVYPFSCWADTKRGQLKHSWLENQVRDLDGDTIVSFWKEGLWQDKIKMEFPQRLQHALELAERLAEGFSPAQLVDQLIPLSSLTLEQRQQLKLAIHQAYLEVSNITALVEPIRQCCHALQPEIEDLGRLWSIPFSTEGADDLRACWERFRGGHATTLHDLLEQLPRGVILP